MNETLLKALHILTRDGKMNADSRRKLKQVHHLAQLIEPYLKDYDLKVQRTAQAPGATISAEWRLADLGAGKSYLGFILYDLVLRNLPAGQILAIEARPELVETSRRLASEAGFDRMEFIAARIDEVVGAERGNTPTEPGAETASTSGARSLPAAGTIPGAIPAKIDVVTALHACDTATDDAIAFGLEHGAEIFALVPCCQAEIARQLEPLSKKSVIESGQISNSDIALFEFPIHRREFGSHLTNVIRVLFLKSRGYRVTVTELVGWEHSMKNELILAEKISDPDHPESRRAQVKLDALLARFHVKPKLLAGN